VCQAAHADNVKQVSFLPNTDNIVISAGQDKELKMWKLEFGQMVDVPYSLVNSVRVAEPIENFCFFMFKNQLHIVAANGPYLSLVRVDEDGLKLLSTVHAFQKPVMKVVYDQ
jgi:hypothetical protein